MGHIAVINKVSNLVEAVFVVDNAKFMNAEQQEIEDLGIAFIKKLVQDTFPDNAFYFKQCSYNGSIRKKYPGPGFKFDSTLEAFIPPKPEDSDNEIWVFNKFTCDWEPTLKPKISDITDIL